MPLRGGPLLGLGLLVSVVGAPAFAGPPLEIQAFSELVRFDDETGALLDEPPSDGISGLRRSITPLVLEAARDEVVAFTLRASGSPGAQPISWRVVESPGEQASPVKLEVFEARAIRVAESSRGPFLYAGPPGRYPDALVPTQSVDPRPAPSAVTLFVDVYVPAETEPGPHELVLSLGHTELPLRVEVGTTRLPPEDVSRLGAVSFGSFQARWQEDRSAFHSAMQLLYAHRFNIEFIPPLRPGLSATVAPDFGAWADALGPYLDGSAFTATAGYSGPRPGRPVTRLVIPITEKWPSPPERGLPRDRSAFVSALRGFEHIVRARGFSSAESGVEMVLFVNDLDEPKTAAEFEALAAYAPLLGALEFRDRIVFRVDGPFGAAVPGWSEDEVVSRLAPIMDAVSLCGAPAWIPRGALQRMRRARPDVRTLVYASNTAGEPSLGPVVLDAPLAGMLAWGWVVARNHLDGALNWEVDFRAGCVAEPRCSGLEQNLDATLVYRAEELGGPTGLLYPSWRLKVLRRGAQDAALLNALAAKKPVAAERLLELVIPHTLDEGPTVGRGAWPKDARSWDRVRTWLRAELEGRASPFGLKELLVDERSEPTRAVWWVISVLTLVLAAGALARRLARRKRI